MYDVRPSREWLWLMIVLSVLLDTLPLPVTDMSGYLTMTPIDARRDEEMAAVRAVCGLCRMSKLGPCQRHGGLTRQQRRVTYNRRAKRRDR